MAIKFNLINTAKVLAAVGAINWGADALGYNLVTMIVPANFVVYVYYLVAAAGVYALLNLNK